MSSSGGQPGNTNGAKGKEFHDLVRKACAQDDWKKARAAVDRMLDLAAEGEEWAVVMLRDTFDGKPKQQVDANLTGTIFATLVSGDAKL